MATDTTYRADAGVTITLTSLADGSWRQSTAVSNTSNLDIDSQVGGSTQVGTSPTAGGTIDIYVYAQYDDAPAYTGGASGSDAAYTADGEETLFKLLTSITVDGTSDQDYEWGPYSVGELFGGVLPPAWGLVVENNTGAALNATGTNNVVTYKGIKFTST